MILRSLFLLLALSVIACDTSPDADQAPEELPRASESSRETGSTWEEREDFAPFFKEADVEGSFLLYDQKQNRYLAYNTARCRTRFSPASTFKIFNSLVALETGVIKDENEVIPWDSVQRDIKEWNQDHTLRSGIKYSVVWLYQELARRVGHEKMQAYLDSAGYGNHTIGNKVDMFWLDGSLRISQEEQIAFLEKLHRNDLPFSRRSIDIVKDIMTLEETPQWIYRGKTGWALRDSVNTGWFVGYLERGDDTWFFATNIEMDGNRTLPTRQEITRKILQHLHLFEE